MNTIFTTGAHLIAFPTDKSRCAQREAQATVLARAIESELRAAPHLQVVLLGDFNDCAWFFFCFVWFYGVDVCFV
jgi:hypothetical protein